MHVAIIEYRLRPGLDAAYAEVAAHLHELVQHIDGFVSVERFESIANPGTFVSVSYWRDEAAIKAWRDDMEHKKGMAKGKRDIFAEYRIVIAHAVKDYDFKHKERAASAS